MTMKEKTPFSFTVFLLKTDKGMALSLAILLKLIPDQAAGFERLVQSIWSDRRVWYTLTA